jgi:MYND finger
MERRLEVRCARCDKGFRARRSSAKYCSNACRQMAYLDRHKPPAPGPLTLDDLRPFTMAEFAKLFARPTPPNLD